MWFVYFLVSEINNDIYVGSTNNLTIRKQQHNNGDVLSTKSLRPWKLKAYLVVGNEKKARALEKYFKTGSGKAILKKRILSDEALV